jgi:hypothetical protein
MAATLNDQSMKPPIISSAITAWRDAGHAVRDMKAVAGIAFLLMTAVSASEAVVNAYLFSGDESGWLQQVLGLVFLAVHSVVATPLAIAVHRYLLLGETMQRYWLDFSSPRFLRFFAFVMAFYCLAFLLPIWIFALVGSGWGGLASVAVFFIAAGVALRCVMIFPAIAVDAAGASLGNALLDAKGDGWRISWLILVTAAPIFAIVILGVVLVVWLPGWAEIAIVIVIDSFMTFWMITGVAAAASRLYAAYGDRLGRPANLRPVSLAAN